MSTPLSSLRSFPGVTALIRGSGCSGQTAAAAAWSTHLFSVRHGGTRHKIASVQDAIHQIPNNATVTIGGFLGQNSPELLLEALGQRFRETGEPKDLTLLFAAGPGDWGARGVNHLAQEGLLKRVMGSHYGDIPKIGEMVASNAIEAYMVPLGAVTRLIRACAMNAPGHLTQIGFGTFTDPKLGGGKLNAKTTEDIVKVIEVEGKECLFYKKVPIDVALIRGTTADPDGNITFERESIYADNMIQAMAGRNGSGQRRGLVIAQVMRVSANGSLNPRNVRVPGTMVDSVVVVTDVDKYHSMSYTTNANPAATGEIRQCLPSSIAAFPLNERKIIARRACMELVANQVVNLGIGMPEGIAQVAREEAILRHVELTTEAGLYGGVGLGGHDYGPAANFDAILEMNQHFDFYNGSGLDSCFLGMGEVDEVGNVNVSELGETGGLAGPGGFVDMSQSTRRVNMVGTFTTGGLVVATEEDDDGCAKLKVVQEGSIKKFVKKVREITFSGNFAKKNSQVVNYITERCVFQLSKSGLTLTEIAPGIDLQRDILDQMEFTPTIREPLGVMDTRIFRDESMRLCKTQFGLHPGQRLHYNSKTNTVYLNMQSSSITEPEQIEELEKSIRSFFNKNAPVGKSSAGGHRRAHMIVNYERFDCRKELQPSYQALAKKCEKELYLSVRRYASRAFTRHKLAAEMHMQDHDRMGPEEFKSYVKTLGVMVTDHDADTIFREHDPDHTGYVSGDALKGIIRRAVDHHIMID